MATNKSGALLGDLLLNYMGNFCSEAFLGAVPGWQYIEGHCIGVWQYLHREASLIISPLFHFCFYTEAILSEITRNASTHTKQIAFIMQYLIYQKNSNFGFGQIL
jgi:hypothetical protein